MSVIQEPITAFPRVKEILVIMTPAEAVAKLSSLAAARESLTDVERLTLSTVNMCVDQFYGVAFSVPQVPHALAVRVNQEVTLRIPVLAMTAYEHCLKLEVEVDRMPDGHFTAQTAAWLQLRVLRMMAIAVEQTARMLVGVYAADPGLWRVMTAEALFLLPLPSWQLTDVEKAHRDRMLEKEISDKRPLYANPVMMPSPSPSTKPLPN